jgi:hypothetical protein
MASLLLCRHLDYSFLSFFMLGNANNANAKNVSTSPRLQQNRKETEFLASRKK